MVLNYGLLIVIAFIRAIVSINTKALNNATISKDKKSVLKPYL